MPQLACQYWWGTVCLGFVFVAARLSEAWIATLRPLAIRPLESRANGPGGPRYFPGPWHVLELMRDPDALVANLARFTNSQREVQRDAFLFPSAWLPLHAFTALVMLRVIQKSLSSPSPPSDASSTARLLLEKYCIQQALHGEWCRVFFEEKRVALALAVA